MIPPKYDGTIHPDEWINQLRNCYHAYWEYVDLITFAKSMVDSSILIPENLTEISELINSLKQHITFTVFKNSCNRKLQLLNFIPERQGGDTTRFIAKFRSLCHDAEINDIEEVKTYFYKTLPIGFIQDTFLEKMNNNINSMSELTQLFESIVLEDSTLIRNGSRVVLKHVATGKYLSSKNKCYPYTTRQMVYAGIIPNSDAQWIIKFDDEIALNKSTIITLEHKDSKVLNISTYNVLSPASNQTEVTCIPEIKLGGWKFKSKNNLKYLKTGDIIILQIDCQNFNTFVTNTLSSHDFTYIVDNIIYQEVAAHEERIGGNDEWCIELIKYS